MLKQIVADKKIRVAEQKKRLPEDVLKKELAQAGQLRPFRQALCMPGIALIAEIKRASPSKGNFGISTPVSLLAQQYESGGAAAISVLTEEDYFLGSTSDFTEVRKAVKVPVLRKDFIIDEYQLYESRLLCADAVLLIAELLPAAKLKIFLAICRRLGLEALVETRSAEQIASALAAEAEIIGINNRDLKTFFTDLAHTEQLAHLVPPGILMVSESGIHTATDVLRMARAGADAILVGEAVALAEDPVLKIRELAGRELF